MANKIFAKALHDIRSEVNIVYAYRTMDFDSFIFFLTSKELYCKRMDFFEDAYEGKDLKFFREQKLQNARKVFNELFNKEKKIPLLTNEEIKFKAGREENNMKKYFINSWYIGKSENPLIWKSYSPNGGIALKIEYDALKAIIKNKFWDESKLKVTFKEVGYIDFNKLTQLHPDDGVFQDEARPFNKHKPYENENEVRLVMELKDADLLSKDLKGLGFPLDKPDVERFKGIFHPKTPYWKKETYRKLIHQLNIDLTIQDSELAFR